jgi:hypothetical protein
VTSSSVPVCQNAGVTESAWPAGDPRRFFEAPIDPAHLRASSPTVLSRALAAAGGLLAGGALVALGWWAIADGRWWPILLGILAVLLGLAVAVTGLVRPGYRKPYRGGQLIPGLVVQQADAAVQLLVLGDVSRDPVAAPQFAYRLVTFRARKGTRFVAGEWMPCVMHGFVGPFRGRSWWSFQAAPVAWASTDPKLIEAASRLVPQPEWDQLLLGAARVTELRRRPGRMLLVPAQETPESLLRPPSRIGVPVQWSAEGTARFVGSVSLPSATS